MTDDEFGLRGLEWDWNGHGYGYGTYRELNLYT